MNAFVLISTGAAVAETMQSYSPDPDRNPASHEFWHLFWWVINIICTVLFSLEWVMRLVGAVAAKK